MSFVKMDVASPGFVDMSTDEGFVEIPEEKELKGVFSAETPGRMAQSLTAAPYGGMEALYGAAQGIAENAQANNFVQLSTPEELRPQLPGIGTAAAYFKAEGDKFEAAAKARRPDVSDMTPFAQGFVNMPESLVQSTGAVLASLATKNPEPVALSLMGGLQAGQSYREAAEAGKTPGSAAIHAGVMGGLEAWTEKFGLGKLFGGLTGKTGLVPAVSKYLAAQVGGEQAATHLQDLEEWVALHPDKSFQSYLDERESRALQTLGGTLGQSMVQGPVFAGVGAGMRWKEEREEKEHAEVLRRAQELSQQSVAEELRNMQVEAGLMPGVNPIYSGEEVQLETSVLPDGGLSTPGLENAFTTDNGPAMGIPPPTHPDIPPPSEADFAIAEQSRSNLPPDPQAVPDAEELTELNRQQGFVQQELPLDVNELTSPEVLARRAQTLPNAVPAGERLIPYSTDQADIGLTPKQRVQAPGTVRALGGNEEDYSPEYVKALVDTIDIWSKKFLPPDYRVVLNLNKLEDTAAGAYQQLKSGIHVITPREITRATQVRGGLQGEVDAVLQNFNLQTANIAAGGITHEFGHAILMSQFAQRMGEQYRFVVQDLSNQLGEFSEEQLTQMPEPEAAVIREFQQMRGRILRNEMTAKEFVEQWLGTWKLGFDLMKKGSERSLYGYVQRALNRIKDDKGYSLTLETATALDAIRALSGGKKEGMQYYLSFEEYMAEQTTRYMHKKEQFKGTPLGTYFERALSALRDFFKMLKKEGIVKPGVAFEAWMEGLAAKRVELEAQTTEKKEKKARKGTTGLAGLKEAKPSKQLTPMVEKETKQSSEQEAMYEMVADELRAPVLRKKAVEAFPPAPMRTVKQKKELTEILELLKQGQYDLAEEMIADVEDRKPKFDLKGKGGNWSSSTVEELKQKLLAPLSDLYFDRDGLPGFSSVATWAGRAVRNYLNKFAATVDDPLRNVPMLDEDVTWGRDFERFTEQRKVWLEELEKSEDQYALVVMGRTRVPLAISMKLDHVMDNIITNVPLDKLLKMSFVEMVLKSEQIDKAQQSAKGKLPKGTPLEKMEVIQEWVVPAQPSQPTDLTSVIVRVPNTLADGTQVGFYEQRADIALQEQTERLDKLKALLECVRG